MRLSAPPRVQAENSSDRLQIQALVTSPHGTQRPDAPSSHGADTIGQGPPRHEPSLSITLLCAPDENIQSTLATGFSPVLWKTHPSRAESPTWTASSWQEAVESSRPKKAAAQVKGERRRHLEKHPQPQKSVLITKYRAPSLPRQPNVDTLFRGPKGLPKSKKSALQLPEGSRRAATHACAQVPPTQPCPRSGIPPPTSLLGRKGRPEAPSGRWI